MTKPAIFANSRWRTAAILKIALSPYISRELSDFDQIWYEEAESLTDTGHMIKITNYENSRWWTPAVLKMFMPSDIFRAIKRQI